MNKLAKLLFQNNSNGDVIEVWQDNQHRWLNINNIEQSRLDIEHPEQLASLLDCYLLSCLLFIDTPNKVLLGGLGGGTLAQHLHRKQPEINGHAIEINPVITQLAKEYFYFPEEKWDIIIDDIRHATVGKNNHRYDLILLDIGENELTPEWLTSETMLVQLKHQLSNHGALAINLLVTNEKSFSQKLSAIRNIFDRQTLCISVPNHTNIVVFAFNNKPIYHTFEQLEFRSLILTQHWGVDFSRVLEQFKKENPEGSGVF